ncbi:HB2J protein, partial [Oenanthe oenanthe]|nr:HB2J protein [Oenanthe oenanthe]
PDPCPAHTEVFQQIQKTECHFINGTKKVRFVEGFIYNREEYLRFDSDVGVYVGFNRLEDCNARRWNSDQKWMEYKRAEVDTLCRHNYRCYAGFSVER